MKRIAIHSAPRSGSTWLGTIFDSHPNVAYRFQPLFSYTHKSQLNNHSSKRDIEKFFNDILNTKDSFVLQESSKETGKIPSFNKNSISHIVYKEVRYHYILPNLLANDNEIKVIGLIRNPFAVINSWLKAPKEFRKDLGWNELEEWQFASKKNKSLREEYNGYEKWKEVALMFEKLKKQYPSRFFLLKYDDLLKNTFSTAENLFKFSGLSMDNQTIDFLNQEFSEINHDPYSVFKSKVDDSKWKESLNPKIIQRINDDINKSSLKVYLDND